MAGYCPEDGGRRLPEPSAARVRGAQGQVTRSRREQERGCSPWPRPPRRGAASGSMASPRNIPGHTFHRLPPPVSARAWPEDERGRGSRDRGDGLARPRGPLGTTHGRPSLGVALTPHLQPDWAPLLLPVPGEGGISFPWLRDLLPAPTPGPPPSPPRWRGFASEGQRPKQRVTATTLCPPHLGLGLHAPLEGCASHAGTRAGRMSAWQKCLPWARPRRVVPVLSAHQYSVLYILIK